MVRYLCLLAADPLSYHTQRYVVYVSWLQIPLVTKRYVVCVFWLPIPLVTTPSGTLSMSLVCRPPWLPHQVVRYLCLLAADPLGYQTQWYVIYVSWLPILLVTTLSGTLYDLLKEDAFCEEYVCEYCK